MLQRSLKALVLLCAFATTTLSADLKPDTALFVNTLPEAVPFYVSMNLYNFYKLSTFNVANKTFPNDFIQAKAFTTFATNPSLYINQSSVPPTPGNIDLLTGGLGKMVLHVRDPRDALISWIEYTDLHKNHPFILGLIAPVPPAEYFTWSYEKKADWQIDHFYGYSINWLDQWASFLSTNPRLQVLVTSFETMATNPLKFFREIVSFYGTNSNQFNEANVVPLTRDQFRATVDDIGIWRARLTPAQQKRVNDALSQKLTNFYHWSK